MSRSWSIGATIPVDHGLVTNDHNPISLHLTPSQTQQPSVVEIKSRQQTIQPATEDQSEKMKLNDLSAPVNNRESKENSSSPTKQFDDSIPRILETLRSERMKKRRNITNANIETNNQITPLQPIEDGVVTTKEQTTLESPPLSPSQRDDENTNTFISDLKATNAASKIITSQNPVSLQRADNNKVSKKENKPEPSLLKKKSLKESEVHQNDYDINLENDPMDLEDQGKGTWTRSPRKKKFMLVVEEPSEEPEKLVFDRRTDTKTKSEVPSPPSALATLIELNKKAKKHPSNKVKKTEKNKKTPKETPKEESEGSSDSFLANDIESKRLLKKDDVKSAKPQISKKDGGKAPEASKKSLSESKKRKNSEVEEEDEPEQEEEEEEKENPVPQKSRKLNSATKNKKETQTKKKQTPKNKKKETLKNRTEDYDVDSFVEEDEDDASEESNVSYDEEDSSIEPSFEEENEKEDSSEEEESKQKSKRKKKNRARVSEDEGPAVDEETKLHIEELRGGNGDLARKYEKSPKVPFFCYSKIFNSLYSKKKIAKQLKGEQLLKGVTFLVTGISGNSRAIVARNKQKSKGGEESEDSSENETEISLLEELETLIRTHGGKLGEPDWTGKTSCIQRGLVKKVLPKTFLISDMPRRTPKYLLALAAGVPCVHYHWLFHSIEEVKESFSWVLSTYLFSR
jgi:hypothetical protein